MAHVWQIVETCAQRNIYLKPLAHCKVNSQKIDFPSQIWKSVEGETSFNFNWTKKVLENKKFKGNMKSKHRNLKIFPGSRNKNWKWNFSLNGWILLYYIIRALKIKVGCLNNNFDHSIDLILRLSRRNIWFKICISANF